MLDFREDVAVLAAESPGRPDRSAGGVGRRRRRRAFPRRCASLLAACAAVTVALAVAVYLGRSCAPELAVRVDRAVEAGDRVDLAAAVSARAARHRNARARSRAARRRCWRASSASLRVAAARRAAPRCSPTGCRRRGASRSSGSLVSWLDSTHNLIFAPIAYVLLAAAAAGGRDRSLARALRRGGRRRGCARSASSRRWPRSATLRVRASGRSVSGARRRTGRCSTRTRSAIR